MELNHVLIVNTIKAENINETMKARKKNQITISGFSIVFFFFNLSLI